MTESVPVIPFAEPSWVVDSQTPYYKVSHHRLRQYIRTYFEQEIFPFSEKWEESGEIPKIVLANFAARGLALPGLPSKYRGGSSLPCNIPDHEWDIFHNLIITEEMHRCPHTGVTWGLFSGNSIACPPIVHFGTEEQKMRFLPSVYKGESIFCLGTTEPAAGSDVAGIKTTAILNSAGTHYIVNGQKKWITNGMWADYVTAVVRTGGEGPTGISVLIVPLKNTKGVTVRRIQNSGLNASGSTFISFEDVIVPKENLIGRENKGWSVIMSNFNPERLSLAVGAVRLARTCYSEAYGHAMRRKTFGKPLVENQVIRAKLAVMIRSIETCHAWVERLAWEASKSERLTTDEGIRAKVAFAKVQAGKTLELCCREAQQIFGGLGISKEGPGKVVEQISRDLRIFSVGGGSEEILDDLGVRITLATSLKSTSHL